MTRTCCTKQCVNDSFSEQALSNASTIVDLSSIVFEMSTCHPWCALNKLRHELTYGEFFNHFDLPRFRESWTSWSYVIENVTGSLEVFLDTPDKKKKKKKKKKRNKHNRRCDRLHRKKNKHH